jgi:hypothetical protein
MRTIRTITVLSVAMACTFLASPIQAAVNNMVFGAPYAAVSNASHSTAQQYTGAGSWSKTYPAPKFELYIDPAAQFGASFTIGQIQSITYHTVNDATNPSDVDFYLQLYTMPYVGGDASWYGNRLNAEPLYSNSYAPPVAWTWNTWNTDPGTNQLTFFDGNHTTNFGFYGGPALQDVQAGPIVWTSYPGAGAGSDPNPIDYASQTVKYVNISTGSGWPAFSGYIDAITIALNTGDSYVIDLESFTDPVYVDDDWVGLAPGVEVEPGKFFGFNAFATVQEGVNNVSGSTVYIAAGTYEEQVEIASDVTVVGAGAGVTIIRAPLNLATFFTTGANSNFPVIYAHDAGAIEIQDLTVDGAARGDSNYRFVGIAYRNAGGSVADCSILDVRNDTIDGGQHGVGIYAYADNGIARTLDVSGTTITGFQKNGMALNGGNLAATVTGNTVTGAGAVDFIAQNGIQLSLGATASITNNTVASLSYTPATYASAGVLVWSTGGAVTVSENSVTDAQVGIWYIDAEGTIDLNTVVYTLAGMGSTPYWWGIVADPGMGARRQPPPAALDAEYASARGVSHTAEAAALTTSVYRNEVDGGGSGTGIEADALGAETLNFTATQNAVGNCEAGFVLYRESGATLNGEVHENSIAGNNFGLLNDAGTLQDATANWWGYASGPQASSNSPGAGDSVSALIDYSPWLGYDDADLGTSGYQPASPMHWYVNTSNASTIQEGVMMASAGDSVTATAGVYNENILINKTLAVNGTSAAAVTVYPASSDIGPAGAPSFGNSQLIVVQANDVSIGGLTLDGDSPTLTPLGTLDARNGVITNFTAGNWNGLRVNGCVVRNIYLRGIYAAGTSGSSGHLFANNTVDNVNGLYLQSAAAMYYAATGDAFNNVVSNSSLGIFFQAGSDGTADSNIVMNCDVGIGANNNNAATSISYNAIYDCGNGGGIQLIMSQFPTDVGYNTLSQCTTGVVVYGGNPAYRQDIHHNEVIGTDLVVSTGVYASTDVSPYGFSPVSAILRNNKISEHGFGVVLAEHPAAQTNLMDVIIGGAAADMDSLFGNGVQELLLQDCNDNINARFNYWGVVECDSIEGRIYHKPDLASLGLVDYSDAPCYSCPVNVTGDVDMNNAITSADIIYLVNFVFKSGPAPLPVVAVGDVNCSGGVNSADIIYLVNFVFKSGLAPCDVCTIL